MKILFWMRNRIDNAERLEQIKYIIQFPFIKYNPFLEDYKEIYVNDYWNKYGYHEGNNAIAAITMQYKPDLVVSFISALNYSWVDNTIYEAIRQKGIRIFNIVGDTLNHLNIYDISRIINCDYLLVPDSYSRYSSYSKLIKNLGVNTKILFYNVMHYLSVFDKAEYSTLPRIYDVSIMGSTTGLRKEVVSFLNAELPKYGYKLNIFGDSDGTDQYKYIPHSEFTKIAYQTKIILSNETYKQRIYQIKGKIFECLSCGALCLSDENPEVKKVIPGNYIVYYKDYYDCIEKINYYLKNEDKRERIAKAAQQWYKNTFNYQKVWIDFFEKERFS